MVRGRTDRIEPRLMLPLSLSYDHRLVDGAAAARFLNEVIDHLQAPARLLHVRKGGIRERMRIREPAQVRLPLSFYPPSALRPFL